MLKWNILPVFSSGCREQVLTLLLSERPKFNIFKCNRVKGKVLLSE